MSTEVPRATVRAFSELEHVARARYGDAGWARALAAMSPPARAACETGSVDPPDALFLEALATADDILASGNGDLATALGEARADAELADAAKEFEGDPLRLLREGASRFYRERANYGATSLEVTSNKAIVRFVVAEEWARKTGDRPPRGAPFITGFLERAVEIVTGTRLPARYSGAAPRIDTRFDRPMMNLVFEFDLEP